MMTCSGPVEIGARGANLTSPPLHFVRIDAKPFYKKPMEQRLPPQILKPSYCPDTRTVAVAIQRENKW